MPGLGASELLDSMLSDAKVLLKKRRGMKVVLLCDGAKELVDLLDSAFNRESLGIDVVRLVDFWHVAEKLGTAATVVFGTGAGVVLHRWKALLLNSHSARGRILRELYDSGKQHVRIGD